MPGLGEERGGIRPPTRSLPSTDSVSDAGYASISKKRVYNKGFFFSQMAAEFISLIMVLAKIS